MFEDCITPQENSSCSVFVTEVAIQGSKLVIFGQTYDSLQEFTTLTEQLQVHGPRLKQINELEPELPCVCLFNDDQQWYRAQTVKQLVCGKWVVEFVDYGNIEAMKPEDIKLIPEVLTVLPKQALSMSVDNTVQPIGNAALWSPAAATCLSNAFQYSDIVVKILKVWAPGKVTIECPAMETALLSNSIAEKTLTYPFSKYPIGHSFKAYLSNINNDGTLFIQEYISSEDLNTMMDNLHRHFSIKANQIALPKSDFQPGTLAVAIYTQDQGFYRAKIVETNGDSSTVHYIDYGDSEQQELTSLFIMPQEFCKLEYQAILCSLQEVNIPTKNRNSALKKLISKLAIDLVLDITVRDHKFGPHDIIEVSVLANGENISEEIAAAGFGVLRHVPQENQISKRKVCLHPLQLAVNENYIMTVSHVEEDGQVYLMATENLEALEELMHDIHEYCENPNTPLDTSLMIGSACCALCSEDQTWYRAKVINIEKDFVTAHFVDYGRFDNCSLSSIKKMKQSFLELEFQSILCETVNPIQSAQFKILEGFLKKVVTVRVVANQNPKPWLVNIFHEGQNIFKLSEDTNCLEFSCLKPESITKIKKIALEFGSSEIIRVTHIISESTFWARLLCNSQEYNEMMENLQEAYEGTKDLAPDLKPQDVCVVYDTDLDKWFRGIKLTDKDVSSVIVFLIDVGKAKVFSNLKIRYMFPDFLSLPAQAVKFFAKNFNAVRPCFNSCFNTTISSQYDLPNSYVVDLQLPKADNTSITTSSLDVRCVDNQNPSLENMYSSCVSFGDFVKVTVCFVEDPDCLWVQQCCNETQLYTLLTEMNSFYHNLPTKDWILEDLKTDHLCCVKIEHVDCAVDFYRGRILCTYGNIIDIKLIDFGNDVTVSRDEVQILALQFLKPKAQALKCRLDNVLPIMGKWSREAVHDLKSLVLLKNNTVMGKFNMKQNLTYFIDLVVKGKDADKNVAQHMIEKYHAIPVGVQPNEGVFVKDSVILDQPGFSPDSFQQKSHKLYYRSPGMAMIGAEIEVIVSASNSPTDFFLQILDLHYRQTYVKLFRCLHDAYTNLQNTKPLDNNLYVGKPCAAFNKKSGNWCRAAILEYLDLNYISVCLVDIGRLETFKFAELKSIDNWFVTAEPPAALRCTLHGIIEPPSNGWCEEGLSMFQDFVQQHKRELICTIHGCVGDVLGVSFICNIRTPCTNIAESLVAKGFCEAVPVLGTIHPPLKRKSYIYSNLDVVRGKEYTFHVTHVENCQLFYCQLERNFDQFDKMMDDLQFQCSENHSPVMTLGELTHDCLCFAKYQKEQWCRAHFISELSNGNVQVIFVDYGNMDVVSWEEVKPFSGCRFAEVPIMALPCCLSDPSLIVADTDQQEKIFCSMKDRILEKLFTGLVAGQTNGKLHLDLFEDGKRINDKITQQVAAIKHPKNESCNLLSDVDSKIMETRLNAEFSDALFLHVGSKEQAVVSHHTSPSMFHVQLKRMKTNRLECEQQVDDLYMAVRNSDYPVSSLKPGNTVCAVHPKSHKWCRAMVMDYSKAEEETVMVLFVDSGDQATVNKKLEVKQLVEEMLTWPKMAVTCKLAGVLPSNGVDWQQHSLKLFGKLVDSPSILVHFLFNNNTGMWTVKLVDDDTDVATQLVSSNNAIWDYKQCKALHLQTVPTLFTQASLTSGNLEEVYISYVDSYNTLFVQKLTFIQSLEALMADINSNSDCLVRFSKVPTSGQICLAKYNLDGRYYRAKIIEKVVTDRSSTTLSIQFVDYGNTSSVSANDVFICPPNFLKAAGCAIRCQVVNIPDDMPSEEIFLKISEISVLEDIVILCTSNCWDNVQGCFKVNLKIKTQTTAILTLPTYLSASDATKISTLPTYTSYTDLLDHPSFKVYISHVVTPRDVYCQLAERCDELERLTTNIAKFLSEFPEEDKVETIDELHIGNPCLAKYSFDGSWYRAIVENTLSNGIVEVRFVDYGNTDKVKIEDVRHSKVSFCLLPIQAVHCNMAFVEKKSWRKSEIDKFDAQVASLELSATFSPLNGDQCNIYDVMLRLPDGTLLNNKYASGTNEERCVTVATVSKNVETNALKNDTDCFSLGGNEEEVNAGQLDKRIFCCPDKYVKPVSSKDSDSYGNGNVVERIETTAIELKSSEPLLSTSNIDLEILHKAYVSYVVDPNNFYVQLVSTQGTLEEIEMCIEKDIKNFENLKVSSDFKLASFCIAQSPQDDMFYRGKIVKLGTKPSVLFIDYGNTALVDWDNIFTVHAETKCHPIQAIHCYLADVVQYSTEKEINMAISTFQDIVMKSSVQIKFISLKTNGQWKVSVSANDQDVSAILNAIMPQETIESKKCFEEIPPLLPSESIEEKKMPFIENFGIELNTSLQEKKEGGSRGDNPIMLAESKNLPSVDIKAGLIRKGVVLEASNWPTFFVQLEKCFDITFVQNTDKVLNVTEGLCLVQHKDAKWYRARILPETNGRRSYFLVDSGCFLSEINEVKTAMLPEDLWEYSPQAVCCKLESSDQASKDQIKHFGSKIVGSKVFVTFIASSHVNILGTSFMQWTVQVNPIINDQSTALFPSASPMIQKIETEKNSFEPCAVSTPLLPDIVVTDVDGNAVQSLKLVEHGLVGSSDATYTVDKVQTLNSELEFIKVGLNELICLVQQHEPEKVIISQIQSMLSLLHKNFKVSENGNPIGPDGDNDQGNKGIPEDHKRPSSSLKGAITSPCKKPRLEQIHSCSILPTQIQGLPDGFTVDQMPNIPLANPPVKIGSIHESFVSYFVDPGYFFVKPHFPYPDKAFTFDVSTPENLPEVNKSMLCLFKSDKENFSRGWILAVKENTLTAAVLDIDTGKIVSMDKDEIYIFPKKFVSFPPLAVQCCLVGVQPLGAKWSKESSECIKRVIYNEEHTSSVRVEFLQCVSSYPMWTVSMTKDNVSLSQLLIDKKLAKETKTKSQNKDALKESEKSTRKPLRPLKDIMQPSTSVLLPSVPEEEMNIGSETGYLIGPMSVSENCNSSISVISDSVFASELASTSLSNYCSDMPRPMSWTIFDSTEDKSPSVDNAGGNTNTGKLKEREEGEKPENKTQISHTKDYYDKDTDGETCDVVNFMSCTDPSMAGQFDYESLQSVIELVDNLIEEAKILCHNQMKVQLKPEGCSLKKRNEVTSKKEFGETGMQKDDIQKIAWQIVNQVYEEGEQEFAKSDVVAIPDTATSKEIECLAFTETNSLDEKLSTQTYQRVLKNEDIVIEDVTHDTFEGDLEDYPEDFTQHHIEKITSDLQCLSGEYTTSTLQETTEMCLSDNVTCSVIITESHEKNAEKTTCIVDLDKDCQVQETELNSQQKNDVNGESSMGSQIPCHTTIDNYDKDTDSEVCDIMPCTDPLMAGQFVHSSLPDPCCKTDELESLQAPEVEKSCDKLSY